MAQTEIDEVEKTPPKEFDDSHDDDTSSAAQTEAWYFVDSKSSEGQNKVEPALAKLLASGQSADKQTGQAIEKLLSSDDLLDVAQGQQLLKLASNPDTAKLAHVAATQLDDRELRQTLIDLVDKPGQSPARAPVMTPALNRLIEMLGQDADKSAGPVAAIALLAVLNNPAVKDTGSKLLSMLGDSSKAPLAEALLGPGFLSHDKIAAAVNLLNDPKRQALSKEFAALLKDNQPGWTVLSPLLDLPDSTKPSDQQNANRLMKMLKNPQEQRLAQDLLTNLPDRRQLHQMLSLIDNPQYKNAAGELVKLIQSEKGAAGARDFLDMLNSKHTTDRSEGTKFLSWINAAKPEDRRNGARVLQLPIDREGKLAVLDSLGRAATTAGTARMLENASSPDKNLRRATTELLNIITSSYTGDKPTGVGLLKMLGGNDAEQKAAVTILTKTDRLSERSRMVSLLSSTNYNAQGQELMRWLQGSNSQRAAASTILQMVPEDLTRISPQTRSMSGDKALNLEMSTAGAGIQEMMRMLGDKNTARQAQTLVSELTFPNRIDAFAQMLRNPKEANNTREIMNMIKSGNPDNVKAAGRVLDMMSGFHRNADGEVEFRPDPRGGTINDPRILSLMQDGETLAKWLANPVSHTRAMQILNQVDGRTDRQEIVQLASNPASERVATKFLKAFSDPEQSDVAKTMLTSLRTPEQKERLLNILSAPEFKHAADQMKLMQPQTVSDLISLLSSPTPATRQCGEQLLKDLNNPEVDAIAQEILSTHYSAQAMMTYRDLWMNDKTRPAAEALAAARTTNTGRLYNSVPTVLEMLKSDDNPDRQMAEALVQRLNSPRERGLTQELLNSVTDDSSLRKALEMAQDPAQRAGLEKLLELSRKSPEREQEVQLGSLMALLTSKNASKAALGQEFMRMLNDPQETLAAQRIFQGARAAKSLESALTKLTATDGQGRTAEATQLARLFAAPDSQSPVTARMLAGMLDSPTQKATAERALAMLTTSNGNSDKTDERSSTSSGFEQILARLETPSQLTAYLKIQSDANSAPALKVIDQMLLSGNHVDTKAARDLLSLHGAPTVRRVQEFDGLGREQNGQVLIQALGDPAARQWAQDMLKYAGSKAQLALLCDMKQSKYYGASVSELLSMTRDPRTADAAQSILRNVTDFGGLTSAAALMKDPTLAAGTRVMLQLFDKGNQLDRIVANNAFVFFGQTQNADKMKVVIGMLSNESTKALGLQLLDDCSRNYTLNNSMLAHLTKMNHPDATKALLGLMATTTPTSGQDNDNGGFLDRRSVATLHDLLTSTTPQKRAEGERLISMLIDENQRDRAARILGRR